MAAETLDHKHILSPKLIKSAKVAKVGIQLTKTRGCNYTYNIPIKYHVTLEKKPTHKPKLNPPR